MTTDTLIREDLGYEDLSYEDLSYEDRGYADALTRLVAGAPLTETSSETLFAALVAGRLDDEEITAMLIALPVRAETAAEMTGAARALRAAATPFPRPDYLFADSCGTGGDGSGSINISTAAAFVAASAGLPVAKHGNRSVTSRCGSADVLEQLGVRIDVPPETSRRALDETGVCFLYAPAYHPGLRHAGPARRALGVRTIMNLLGPCVNPAAPPVQLLGVADPLTLEPVARTLAALGVRDALVVHGGGLDEIALHGDTQAIRLTNGALQSIVLRPEDAGITRRPVDAVAGGNAEANAAGLAAVLQGRGPGAHTDAVALNAGALLMTAGLASDLNTGVALAKDRLASGAPYERLTAFAEATRA